MRAETGAWMPMYWADYLGDTTHLSTEEHGAYLLLIATYWRRAKPLPDDDRWLANVTKLSLKRWKKARPIVTAFFLQADGPLTHERVEFEILKSCGRIQSARAAAHHRHMPLTTTKSPQERKAPLGLKERKPPTQGTRLPEDWVLPYEWLEWAERQDPFNLINLNLEGERFRDYWCAKAGKDATKRDWFGTWRNWVRRAVEMVQERRGKGRGENAGKTEEASPAALAQWRQQPQAGARDQEEAEQTGKFRSENSIL